MTHNMRYNNTHSFNYFSKIIFQKNYIKKILKGLWPYFFNLYDKVKNQSHEGERGKSSYIKNILCGHNHIE